MSKSNIQEQPPTLAQSLNSSAPSPEACIRRLRLVAVCLRADARKDDERSRSKRTQDYDRSFYTARATMHREDAAALDWLIDAYRSALTDGAPLSRQDDASEPQRDEP